MTTATAKQPTLFDAEQQPRQQEKSRQRTTARTLRDAAIAQVEANADTEWIDAAQAALRFVCRRFDTMTVDDVQEELARRGVERPREGRAMGAVMTCAKREGLITPTGSYRASEQPQCHGNPRQVWRSLLRETKQEAPQP